MSHGHVNTPATFFTVPHNHSACTTPHRHINILYRHTQLQCMYHVAYTRQHASNILYGPTQLQRMYRIASTRQHSLQTHTTTVHVPRRIDTSTFFTDTHNYSACTTSHRHVNKPATFFQSSKSVDSFSLSSSLFSTLLSSVHSPPHPPPLLYA